ncbi:hypothetical protein PRK78_005102 [Emydomyces testavorans]|uniref:Zn(2)-C6 fungal-type domain-containing protein n=1 Tax=Emydomyces testavorans TaxID=2070801 RepID=A0AAF0IJR1_9EURO|nr:hypothetical protein PRK78_005102 [Emydomyces testavorans]
MFHTFEGFENPDKAPGQSRDGRGKAGKRSSTLRACEQCRRRKIRCDGEQPCEACQWYKKTDLCHYSDPRPSRRHVEKLSSTVEEYRSLFEKLFPSTPLQSLLNLSREKLLELASNSQLRADSSPTPVSVTKSPPPADNHASQFPPEDANLESLQTMPDDSTESRESRSPDLVATVSDDVNALSLSTKRPSTYLGISSVNAVMRVIMWMDPDSTRHFSETPDRQPRPKLEQGAPPEGGAWYLQTPAPSVNHIEVNTMQLINAYFAYFHPFNPLIDEQLFRETVLLGKRFDPRWLALQNIVFALGCIAAYTADDTSHESYYLRARHYLSMDTLGNPHLETIQTLALMGGNYLHYISQPNLAHSLMGVALRMATMLGLHKEFTGNQDPASQTSQRKFSVDLRRRVWWSLFCLDTWGYMTLGRPSMGRWGPGITAKLPQYQGNMELAICVLSLVENTRFCKIATQVGDALAASPIVTHPEMVSLDNQMVEWHNSLPPLLKDHEPCSDTVSTTRTVMRWRYQSQRILLHRPVLLSYAMRRVPYVALRTEERYAIERCRMVADETIRDVASTTRLNQMTGWNAVWLLFQATLVPLLGLFIADSTATHMYATLESCRNQVETAIVALERLESWSPTAKRTLEVVSRILEASQRPRNTTTSSLASGTQTRTTSASAHSVAPLAETSTAAPFIHTMNQPTVLGNACFQDYQDIAHYMEPSTQQMLDYISWGDNNIWPSVQEDLFPHPAAAVGLFCQGEDYLKPLDHGVAVAGGRQGTYHTGLAAPNLVRFQ